MKWFSSAALRYFTLAAISLLSPGPAIAFARSTHEVLSERAARESSALGDAAGKGDLLKTTLPEFWLGLDQKLEGVEVYKHIRNGSNMEDEKTRPFNHFHDPTRAWDSAGFRLLPLLPQLGDSSVLWQQSADAHQWPKARESYLTALLEKDPAERERLFAETFRRIGHVVHLVQDVATPAHSRNDNHFFVDRFHVWAADQRDDDIAAIGSVPFTGDLTTATNDSSAPRPIARLIDATEGDRGAPVATTLVGLAEYSNSQFLSDDRLFGTYTYPRLSALEPVDSSYNGTVPGARRHYLQFPSGSPEGEAGYFVAARLPLYDKTPPNRRRYATWLDDSVLADYGRKLLPRAIGYSVSAIDHFFRGRIEISAPDRFAYGRALYQPPSNTSSFTSLRFHVANDSPNGHETATPGSLWAVVHYREADGNLFEEPGSDLDDEPKYAVSAEESSFTLSRNPQEVTFDFSADPIPANAADVWLIVVYQGELSGETDAVLVGGVDLPEPNPIDYANLTDYDCVDGTPYYVADLPPNDSARDLDGDGQEDLKGPYLESGTYHHASETQWNAFTTPGNSPYSHSVSELRVLDGVTPVARVVILHDASPDPLWHNYLNHGIWDEDGVALTTVGIYRNCEIPIVRNDYDRSSPFHGADNRNPRLVSGAIDSRRFPVVRTYRGWSGFELMYMYQNPNGPGIRLLWGGFDACLSQLGDAAPDLTFVPGVLAPE